MCKFPKLFKKRKDTNASPPITAEVIQTSREIPLAPPAQSPPEPHLLPEIETVAQPSRPRIQTHDSQPRGIPADVSQPKSAPSSLSWSIEPIKTHSFDVGIENTNKMYAPLSADSPLPSPTLLPHGQAEPPLASPILRAQSSIRTLSFDTASSRNSLLDRSMQHFALSLQHFQEVYQRYEIKRTDRSKTYQNIFELLGESTLADPVDLATALQKCIDETLLDKEHHDRENFLTPWIHGFLKKMYPMMKFVMHLAGGAISVNVILKNLSEIRLDFHPPRYRL